MGFSVIFIFHYPCSDETVSSGCRPVRVECDVSSITCSPALRCSDSLSDFFVSLYLKLILVVSVHGFLSGGKGLVWSSFSKISSHALIAPFLQLGFVVRCFTCLSITCFLGLFGGSLFDFSSAITAFCLHLVTIEVRLVLSRMHSFGVVFKCPVMILPANIWALSSFSKLVLESQGCQAAPA